MLAFDNERCPRNMYLRDQATFSHHREKWGQQSDLGYKDFIPVFSAERWNPEAWVDLFAKSGAARYTVPAAEHHGGFPMYDCAYTE